MPRHSLVLASAATLLLAGSFTGAQPRTTPPGGPAAAARPQVAINRGVIVGGPGTLTVERADAVVRPRQAAMLACYERTLVAHPSLGGTMQVRVALGANGRPRTVTLTGLDSAPDVRTCLTRALRALAFPAPGVATVEYAFSLEMTSPNSLDRGNRPQMPHMVLPTQAPNPLPREVIRRVAGQHRGEVSNCHQRVLVDNPRAAGEVIIRFTVAVDGTVSEASVSRADPGLDAAAECIASRVQGWTFPVRDAGGPVNAEYPFTLTSAM